MMMDTNAWDIYKNDDITDEQLNEAIKFVESIHQSLQAHKQVLRDVVAGDICDVKIVGKIDRPLWFITDVELTQCKGGYKFTVSLSWFLWRILRSGLMELVDV